MITLTSSTDEHTLTDLQVEKAAVLLGYTPLIDCVNKIEINGEMVKKDGKKRNPQTKEEFLVQRMMAIPLVVLANDELQPDFQLAEQAKLAAKDRILEKDEYFLLRPPEDDKRV